MNKLVLTILTGALAATSCSGGDTSLSSPDGQVTVDFALDGEGRPTYCVVFQNETIVAPSALGFEFKNQAPCSPALKLLR